MVTVEEELIARAEKNIWQAIKDYGKHTCLNQVMEDVSGSFVRRLARDSVRAKQELRELFSKSPAWNEELDALVINGTRTHDPDSNTIFRLARQILYRPQHEAGDERFNQIDRVIHFFSSPDEEAAQRLGIEAINEIAPGAYVPGKKRSRIFKAVCKALGVVDETAGSEFQKLYAQFADELTTRQIGFKLFVSINPAHFITMSNPKCDDRGSTLTSCHSFNSTESDYNNGCSGYARDRVSFIVFTVADPTDAETLNNRKTTRQIFAYKPGNGLLLQSRLYNTSGGTRGAQADSDLYRDLIQREISLLEEQPNLWKLYSATSAEAKEWVNEGFGFGGYPDWTYPDFNPKLCVRKDCEDTFEPIEVGAYGLCIMCGEEIDEKLYCEDCIDRDDEDEHFYCDDCEAEFDSEDNLTYVYDVHGNGRNVCPVCLDRNYRYCDACNEYYYSDRMRWVGDECFCDDCYDELCGVCDSCDEDFRNEDLTEVINSRGFRVMVCESCRDEDYERCCDCEEYFHRDRLLGIGLRHNVVCACETCAENNYSTCDECGDWYDEEMLENGLCPDCRANEIEESEDIAV